jgi:hypothetical protein
MQLEGELDQEARRISEKYEGALVAIVLDGSQNAKLPRCVTGISHPGEGRKSRLKDLIAILLTSIQTETLREFGDLRTRRSAVEDNDARSGGGSLFNE